MAIVQHQADLGSLVDAVVSQKDWRRRLWLHQVFVFWDDLVGREISQHAQPEVIRGDVLWLAVSDSSWMQQLTFERHHLLQLINARLAGGDKPASVVSKDKVPPPCLKEIKFTLDPSYCRRQSIHPSQTATREVDEDKFAQFASTLNSIEDQSTRESMKRLWLVMHRRG